MLERFFKEKYVPDTKQFLTVPLKNIRESLKLFTVSREPIG